MKRIGLLLVLLLAAALSACLGPDAIPPIAENIPPVAAWTALRDGTMPLYQWLFRADGYADSYDPDGEIVAYIWRIDGETFRQPTVLYQFPQAGCYRVSLTVIDNDGASDTLEWPECFEVAR